MKNKVLKTIKKYNLIENGDKLVLGVSGGPDSIAMLNILNDLSHLLISHNCKMPYFQCFLRCLE